jgi:hypothetical protein
MDAPIRRVALVLHGRIGIWRVRASHIDDADVVWKANAPHRWREAPKTMDGIDHTPHSTLAHFAPATTVMKAEHSLRSRYTSIPPFDAIHLGRHRGHSHKLDSMHARPFLHGSCTVGEPSRPSAAT